VMPTSSRKGGAGSQLMPSLSTKPGAAVNSCQLVAKEGSPDNISVA
jgi:hypothetical protein